MLLLRRRQPGPGLRTPGLVLRRSALGAGGLLCALLLVDSPLLLRGCTCTTVRSGEKAALFKRKLLELEVELGARRAQPGLLVPAASEERAKLRR